MKHSGEAPLQSLTPSPFFRGMASSVGYSSLSWWEWKGDGGGELTLEQTWGGGWFLTWDFPIPHWIDGAKLLFQQIHWLGGCDDCAGRPGYERMTVFGSQVSQQVYDGR